MHRDAIRPVQRVLWQTRTDRPQLTAPLDVPLTPLTLAKRGRRVERLMPTPPPRDMISTIVPNVSMIPHRLSLGEGNDVAVIRCVPEIEGVFLLCSN